MADTADQRRHGYSVRVRITAAVAALVLLALGGAGLIVYLVEVDRVEAAVAKDAEQELDEFAQLQRHQPSLLVGALLRLFLRSNVPDDDELLVGWMPDGRKYYSPKDSLIDDPEFLAAAEPLVEHGGTTFIDTDRGKVRITSQPVTSGDQTGALLVVKYVDDDRAELVSTMRTYTIVALLSLIVITWVAWSQAGRLLSPLRALRRTADEITATDLSRRVPETGNDDITALTRTVNGMLDRLESAFVGQRQFLDDAGHELKTPLTVLRGHLELLDSTDPAEVEETRALLLDEVDRMARLVADLMLLAKSDRPDFLTLAEVDPADLATAVLAKARALGDRDWQLEPGTIATAGTLVVVDEQRLTQALLQLADNAVKHTTVGQQIAVGAAVGDGTLELWVRDTGRGVREQDRERIFERFGRSVVPPGDEGFGLGLSIVSAIAKAHGGRVYVAEPGTPPTGLNDTGSRFVIEVPVVRPELESGPEEQTMDLHVEGARWPAS